MIRWLVGGVAQALDIVEPLVLMDKRGIAHATVYHPFNQRFFSACEGTGYGHVWWLADRTAEELAERIRPAPTCLLCLTKAA